MPSPAGLLLRLVCCTSAIGLRAAAAPPMKLAIPAAAEGKVGKMQCASGSISIITAQFGV